MKLCDNDKILNPVTNRCVKKEGKIGKALLEKDQCNPVTNRCVKKEGKIGKDLLEKDQCKDDQVLNPVTNRCVKKEGKFGKALLEKKDQCNPVTNRCVKKEKNGKVLLEKKDQCKDDQVLNPVTNRCVKKNGKIGQKLLNKKDKTQSSKSSSQNSNGIDDTCFLNYKLPLHIYHIMNQNDNKILNTNDLDISVKYFPLFDDNLLFENLNKIINTCQKNNILIYCSSFDIPSIAEKLNIILPKINILSTRSVSGRTKLYNVSIINFCDKDKIVYTPENPKFRNILNIYNGKHRQYKFDKNEFKNDFGIYYFAIMKTKSKNNELIDQWWYKYYYNIPPCSTGRLKQFTGTCWFNAALNSLLLSETTQALLVSKWVELPKKEKIEIKSMGSLDNCLKNTVPLRIMLFMVIYNILVKRNKLSEKQGNWIKELAGATKSLYLTSGESEYRNLKLQDLKQIDGNAISKYSWGGWPTDALKMILGNLFRQTEFKIINLGYVPWILPYHLKTTRDNALDEFLNSKTTITWNTEYLNQLYHNRYWNNVDNELLILFEFPHNKCQKLQTEIIIENKKYFLESASIILENHQTHAIAGLKCDSKWYIYDSQNYITYCNWPSGNFSEYHKLRKDAKLAEYQQFYFTCALYVRKPLSSSE